MLDERVFKDNIFLISIKIYDSYSAQTIKTNKQRHHLFFFFVFVFFLLSCVFLGYGG